MARLRAAGCEPGERPSAPVVTEAFMADYFTHFSCLLDVGTAENAARALAIYNTMVVEAAIEDPLSEQGNRIWLMLPSC